MLWYKQKKCNGKTRNEAKKLNQIKTKIGVIGMGIDVWSKKWKTSIINVLNLGYIVVKYVYFHLQICKSG